MQTLLVSMMRLSTAMALFGWEQVQHSMNVLDGGEDINKAIDRVEKALNSLTDTLVNRMDGEKRETVNSVTKMSKDVVDRSFDSVSMMDPREMMRAGNDLMQKTTNATAEWVSKTASAVEETVEDDEVTPKRKKRKAN